MSIVLWILGGLFLVSLAEWTIHRYLMHRPSISLFRSHYREHAIDHHARYYRQFDLENDPRGKHLNLRLSVAGTLLVITGLTPILLLSIEGFFVMASLAVLHAIVWNTIHCEMHLKTGRFFSTWRIYRCLKWHHFLHHQHVNRNFNVVLPVCDHLFGTLAKPTSLDTWEWEIMDGKFDSPDHRNVA